MRPRKNSQDTNAVIERVKINDKNNIYKNTAKTAMVNTDMRVLGNGINVYQQSLKNYFPLQIFQDLEFFIHTS